MKHLKNFEPIVNDNPKIGEYVICDLSTNMKYDNRPEVVEFVNTHIGIIKAKNLLDDYSVTYENVPRRLEKSFHFASNNIWINEEYIIDHSTNFDKIKSKMEIRLASNKYNI